MVEMIQPHNERITVRTIDHIKQQVKDLVPKDWQVCEGCFIDFSNLSMTNSHVSIQPNYPKTMKFKERLEKYGDQLSEVKRNLIKAGLKAKADRTTIYVFPN